MKEPKHNKDINIIMERFKNLETITYQLKTTIGVIGKSKIRFSVTREDPYTRKDQQVPYDMASVSGNNIKTLENIAGNSYIVNKTNVSGLFQHDDNASLYIAMTPDNQTKTMKICDVPDEKDVEGGKTEQTLKKTIKILNRVANMHQNKKVTLLVLDRETGLSYGDCHLLKDKSENRQFPFSNIENDPFNEATDSFQKLYPTISPEVDFFYLDMDKDKNNLNPDTLNHLYKIYRNTIKMQTATGKPDPYPLIIQCKNALDKASKIAFAFEILRNFDKIFQPTITKEVNANLLNNFDQLRRSVSTHALTNVDDIKQAIALAFALKLTELEWDCIDQIKKLIASRERDNKFSNTIKPPLENILDGLTDLHSSKEKANYVLSQTMKNDVLKSHCGLTLLPLSNPLYYTLLKRLHFCYEQKNIVENKLFSICHSVNDNTTHMEEAEGYTA